MLMELIKDENSDVRLNVANGMIKMAGVLGPDLLSPAFLTTITSMTKDVQWRVRLSVFELIGDLSKIYGKEIFVKHLEPIFMQYLTNTAAAVREMGIAKSREIAERFKADWVVNNYLPKVLDNYNGDKQGYNFRMASLNSLHSVMGHLSKDQIT